MSCQAGKQRWHRRSELLHTGVAYLGMSKIQRRAGERRWPNCSELLHTGIARIVAVEVHRQAGKRHWHLVASCFTPAAPTLVCQDLVSGWCASLASL